ncbi:MAG: hypothetical protein WCY29_00135 [Novosphingobium sp.]
MSYGHLAPYRRRIYGRDDRFATGSLLFDLHRHRRLTRNRKSDKPHKTRLFTGL